MIAPNDPTLSLRRTLRLHRIALFVLGGIALGVVARIYVPASAARAGFRVIDLSAEIATAARTRAEEADTVLWFLRAPEASIHLHVLGAHQTCPLHIHRKSHEATLILSGAADVSHVYGPEASEHRLTHAGPGTLIASPPFCGHAWKNGAPDGLQANLVMEAPPFDGNLYLDDSDRARANGPPPEIDDVLADLADFSRSSEPSRTVALPFPETRLSILLLRSEGTIPASPKGTVAVYTVAGEGTLRDATTGAKARLAPTILVLATGATSLAVHVDVPTALVVFRL